MNLTLSRQALLLDFIFDAGWINREAQYCDFIDDLTRQIEANITQELGNGWKVREAYGRLLLREMSIESRDKLSKPRGHSNNGNSVARKAYRGVASRNSNPSKTRRQNPKAKELHEKKR